MPSPPLDSTHGRTWHDIISLRQHTRSIDVGCGMKSPPLDCTHDRTMSGVTCHHHLWAAPSVERRLLWHVIIAVGQHTRLNDIVRGITSLPLDSTLGRQRLAWHEITAFGQHTRSNDIGHGIPSSPLGSTHGQTTSGLACHHRIWASRMVK